MFDLSTLDIVAPSEQGRTVTLVNPKDGSPLLDSDKKPVQVTVLGRHSSLWAELTKQMGDEFAAASKDGWGEKWIREQQSQWDVRRLAAVTKGWTLTHYFGEPIECVASVAEKVYADKRMAIVYAQVWNFQAKDANFLDV